MSEINQEMKDFALRIKNECTKNGYVASICLADGKGHGEFYHNIDEVDYSMIRFIYKNNKIVMHFKSYMNSRPVETNMCINALAVISDIMGLNALSFMEALKGIEQRVNTEKEKSKIIPFNYPKPFYESGDSLDIKD